MLTKLLEGKIVMEPVVVNGRHGYRGSGSLNLGRLLSPDVLDALRLAPTVNSRSVVAPTGHERSYRIQVRDFIGR